MSERVNVICFGNPLHGDDGFGPAVCELLRSQPWPAQVGIHEAGIRGIDTLDLFAACDHAILIDAMVDDSPSGDLLLLDPDSILPEAGGLLTHGAGLGHLLALLPTCVATPPSLEILVASTEPPVQFQPRLSAATAAAVPRAADWVSERVRQLKHGQA